MQPNTSPATPRHRPPAALVLRDPPADEVDAAIDWTSWYLTDEEDMGQNVEQADEIEVVLSSLRILAEERAWTNVLVAFDNFFAWIKAEPLVRVSPDVYLLDDPPPRPWPKSWQTWIASHKPPRWAMEIVSEDWTKDYEDNPPKYAQLGTRELVIVDPYAPPRNGGTTVRVPLQVYRRGEDGAFVRAYAGNGPARSEEIDAWIVLRLDANAVHVRLARDAEGFDIVPTAIEAREAERGAKDRLAQKLSAMGIDPTAIG